MNVFDRWIIGGLVFALSCLIWFIIVEIKEDVRNIHLNEAITSTRLSILEERVKSIDRDMVDVKGDLGKHRQATEKH